MAKFSISVPGSLAGSVKKYRKKQRLRSRSAVFAEAVKLLQSRELETPYEAAAAEYHKSWEVTSSDGLANETW